MTDRAVRCRYTDRLSNRCTAVATDPSAPLVLCQRHLAAAVETIRELAATYPGLLATPKETSR